MKEYETIHIKDNKIVEELGKQEGKYVVIADGLNFHGTSYRCPCYHIDTFATRDDAVRATGLYGHESRPIVKHVTREFLQNLESLLKSD